MAVFHPVLATLVLVWGRRSFFLITKKKHDFPVLSGYAAVKKRGIPVYLGHAGVCMCAYVCMCVDLCVCIGLLLHVFFFL